MQRNKRQIKTSRSAEEEEAACRMTLQAEQKNALLLILSQELCELCSAEGGEGGEAATSNYLDMRSLFGSIASRLWL